MSEQLHEFINAQHQTNIVVAQTMARIEQKLDDNTARLFGAPGQTGTLVYMREAQSEVAARVAKLETWKTGTLKWIGGVVAVLTLEGTAFALYFNHIIAKIQPVVQSLTR